MGGCVGPAENDGGIQHQPAAPVALSTYPPSITLPLDATDATKALADDEPETGTTHQVFELLCTEEYPAERELLARAAVATVYPPHAAMNAASRARSGSLGVAEEVTRGRRELPYSARDARLRRRPHRGYFCRRPCDPGRCDDAFPRLDLDGLCPLRRPARSKDEIREGERDLEQRHDLRVMRCRDGCGDANSHVHRRCRRSGVLGLPHARMSRVWMQPADDEVTRPGRLRVFRVAIVVIIVTAPAGTRRRAVVGRRRRHAVQALARRRRGSVERPANHGR